jgi:hypothetical protein
MSFKDSAYYSRSSKLSTTASTTQSTDLFPTRSLAINKERAISATNLQPLSRRKLTTSLRQAMQGLNSAALLLQDTGFCCDRYTILTISDRDIEPTRQVPVVRMSTITFECIKELEGCMTELDRSGIYGEGLSKSVSASIDILEVLFGFRKLSPPLTIDQKLHLCALAVQVLCLGLTLYSQGHAGEFHPMFLKDPLNEVTLAGSLINQDCIVADLRELACMGSMIGDKVFVFRASHSNTQIQLDASTKLYLSAICEEIVDTWGPGYFIADGDAAFGERLYGLRIGGGIIKPHHVLDTGERQFHWSPDVLTFEPGMENFDYREQILIGALTVNNACPMDEGKSRTMSMAFLANSGTESDVWDLDERQVIAGAANYAQLQVGNVYHKQHGKTVKTQLLDRWASIEDLCLFNSLWGLQVSLCTGVTRRVPLRTLIEEPLFPFIDRLRVDGWESLKTKARQAFKGDINFDQWIKSLDDPETKCMKFIFGKLLELFKDTGFDRTAEKFSILWPHYSNPYFCVKVRCDKAQLWFKMLKDSECCATFAVNTSLCLETSEHKCRMMVEAPWHGGGTLLSTAVCPDLTGAVPSTISMTKWQLQDNKTYWVGKCGGEIWVLVRKMPNSDTELHVKRNRFPKHVSSHLWKRQILREKQDASFWAEEVLVICR